MSKITGAGAAFGNDFDLANTFPFAHLGIVGSATSPKIF
jgi:hypothetical protein